MRGGTNELVHVNIKVNISMPSPPFGTSRSTQERDLMSLLHLSTPGSLSVGELRATGLKNAHHVIQDVAVRDIPGYNSQAASGMQLPGPSTARGTPHCEATQVQRQAGGGYIMALNDGLNTKLSVKQGCLHLRRGKPLRKRMLISEVLE